MSSAAFRDRHIGTDAEAQAIMLGALGYESVDALVERAVPASIHAAPIADSAIPFAATEAEALAALGRVKAELYSLGQSSLDPAGTGSGPGGRPTATFIFGFTGVGGDVIVPDPDPAPVPVPASALLLLGGLGSLALARRRRPA